MGTILDIQSFDTGTNGPTLLASEFDAVSVVSGGKLEATTPGFLNGYVVYAPTGTTPGVSYGERDWGLDQETICIELLIKFNVAPVAITSFLSLLDSGAAAICDLQVDATGHWSLYNYGSTTTYTSTGPVLIVGQWYRIELKLVSDAAAGTLDVKVNDKLEPGLSGLTGINTKPAGQPRRYRIGVTTSQASAPIRCFENLIVSTDWIGRSVIVSLLPAGAVTENWTVVDSGKTNWQVLAYLPFASATSDLIKSSVADQEEHLTLDRLSNSLGGCTVLGVRPVIRQRRGVAGTAAAVLVCIRSGSSDGASASLDSGSTTFGTLRGVLQTTDPATGLAWTLAAVNAMKLKFTHDAGVGDCQINAAAVYVALGGLREAQLRGTLAQAEFVSTGMYHAVQGQHYPASDQRYVRRARGLHGVTGRTVI